MKRVFRTLLKYAGVLIAGVGLSAADSELLFVPVIMIAVGLLLCRAAFKE